MISHSSYKIVKFCKVDYAGLFRFDGQWLKKMSLNAGYPELTTDPNVLTGIIIIHPNTLVGVINI